MKTFVINGGNFSDIDGFYSEIDEVLTRDLKWDTGHNLDALNDLLRGGFGRFEEGEKIVINWKNIDKSRKDLGEKFSVIMDIINDHKNHIELIEE